MNRFAFPTVALCVCLGFAALARAGSLSNGDKDRVKSLTRNIETMAQESRLAPEHAESDGVKHFAELTLREHDEMLHQLHDFCAKHEFAFDADPTKPDVKDKRELESLKGKEFDRVYMSEANRELKETSDLLKDASEHADDHDLRKWAKDQLGVVDQRLANAKELYKKVKAKE